VFISGENFRFVNGTPSNEPLRYRLGPSFYFFKNNFYSTDYPVINAVFESHLQHITDQGNNDWLRSGLGILSDNDRANLILKNMSFRELLSKNPSGDTLRTVLTVKGDWFFNFLRSKAGLREFKPWFSDYIDKHRFTKIDLTDFNVDFNAKFGFDFYPKLDDWFNSKKQPGFLFTDLKGSEIIVGDRSRYQVTFIASNPEPVAGLFNIAFNTGSSKESLLDQKIRMNRIQVNAGGGSKFSIELQGRGMDADDISKIVFLGPGEAKRIGIVLDAEPRAMLINTLFARNLPGEIVLPFNEISKSRADTKEFSGEELLSSLPPYSDPSEIIVDNEDPGFIYSKQNISSPLKKLLRVKNRDENTYMKISDWNTPEYWQPVVLTDYYGKYVRSALYTKSGTGTKSISWHTLIKKPGYYDIYCYVGKIPDRIKIRSGSDSGNNEENGSGGNDNYKDMHYKVYYDEGVDDISVDYQHAEGGWNNLGRFYLSHDSAKVVLTNKSSGRIVIGDAVKWVLQH
jgi:hypothetical protein